MLRKTITKTITAGLLLTGMVCQGVNAKTPDHKDTTIYLGFFNPEMVYHHTGYKESFRNSSRHTSLSPSLGVNLNRWFQVSAGPVISVSYKGAGNDDFLLSDIYTRKLDDNSNLNVGFKVSLALVLSK